MIRIMFVCHGNICRSPMAEFIMKDMLRKNGMDDVFVASSATSTEEIWGGRGNPIYPPARDVLTKHKIPFDEHYAVQIKRDDYDKYDIIAAMDGNNVRNILRIVRADPGHKVRRLLEFAGINRDVADPWYTGDFESAYRDILCGCEALIGYIRQMS